VPGQCGCTPRCTGKVCGSDGCGGTCGTSGSTLPNLGLEGFCVTQAAAPPGFADREILFTCFAGNIYYENCKVRTGQANGVCQTLVSQFGHQSNCYCDVCVRYDVQTRQCLPACSGSVPTCATGPAGSYSCFP